MQTSAGISEREIAFISANEKPTAKRAGSAEFALFKLCGFYA